MSMDVCLFVCVWEGVCVREKEGMCACMSFCVSQCV